MDRIKGNSKPPYSQIKDEATGRAKHTIFLSLIWGEWEMKFQLASSKVLMSNKLCVVFNFKREYIDRISERASNVKPSLKLQLL